MSLSEFFSGLWARIKEGGGLLTTPRQALNYVSQASGEAVSNLFSPLLPILAVLVFVYAFGSNR